MSTEALALLDSSQAASQQAGAKKRNRTDETGAVADFAAILAQMQGGATNFQRAELNLAVPQQADPTATTTPAAEPVDRDRGRDRQALDGDDKGRNADEPMEARDDTSRRSDDAARRSNDAAQRPLAGMTMATATDTAAAPQAATQAQTTATQAQAQPQAVDPNKAQATAKAQAEIAAAAQAPETGTANGAAGDAARQNAASSLPAGVKVKTEVVQDNAAPTTGATLNAATALAAQSQRSGPTDVTATTDAASLGDVGDGTANTVAQVTPFASRSNQGQGENQGQNQSGQGNAQHGQTQQQAANQIAGQPTMPAGAMPGAVAQPAQAGFQAALNAAGSNNQGGSNGQQPVQTIGGESLTSTAAVTGQASNTTGRAGSAAQPSATRPHVPTTPADQVAVQIQRAAGQGSDKISIQLSPEELGRIDVKLEMKDGKMHALISADRPETLDMLKQDARGLVQSLQNAGLQTDAGSLSFNLRGGDAQAQNQNQGGNNGQQGWQGGNTQDQADQRPAHPLFSSPQDLARAGTDGRLDVRV